MLYLSNGNVPSRWTHSFQAMKMAEALARQTPEFELVTACHGAGRFRPRRWLWRWYDVHHPFSVEAIFLGWRRAQGDASRVTPRGYARAAVDYARRRSRLVMTRSYRIAQSCLEAGLEVVFETHTGPRPDHDDYLRAIGGHPRLRGVVTVWKRLADHYAGLGIPTDRILVSPHGADVTGRWSGAPASARAAARRLLRLPQRGAIAVYAGHLRPEKGVDVLLAAAERLPGVHFLLLGGWPAAVDELVARARRLANLRVIGFVANRRMKVYLAAADVCVLPGSLENATAAWELPLKHAEYSAARRPIVAAALPSLCETLTDGVELALVRPDDPAALADAIAAVLSGPECSERLAEGAWRWAQAHSWDARAGELLRAFAPELLALRAGDDGGARSSRAW